MSTWVLLRGLARERRHWGDFPERFGAVVGAGRVVTLDLPGNGQLNALDSPLRVDDMARWVADELRRRELPPPYHVLAVSLGGMVAVAWARMQPQALRAAVVINTSMRPFSPFYRRLRPSAWWPVVKMLTGAHDAARRERTVLDLISNHRAAADAAWPHWVACARENPISGRNALRQLWAAARFSAPRTPPPVSFLVLTSAADRMVDPSCSRALARQWGCALREHASAGHDLPLDDGAWVSEQVAQWLADQSSVRRE
jgi:pimeloyl-ACP methyl ester carboxylesterase